MISQLVVRAVISKTCCTVVHAGTWGYIQAAHELLEQTAGQGFDRLAVVGWTAPHRAAGHGEHLALSCQLLASCVLQACGSGGTTAGLALGLHLSGSSMAMTSYGVCDSPEVFYSDVNSLLEGLGHDVNGGAEASWQQTPSQ